MQIIPEDYQSLEISILKKKLLTLFSMIFDDDVYSFIDTNPTGKQKIDITVVHRNKGVFFFIIDEQEKNVDQYVQLMESVWKFNEEIITNKIKRERLLIDENSNVAFPIHWIYIIPNKNDNHKLLEDNKKVYLYKNAYDYIKENFENLFHINSQFEPLTTDQINKIGYLIAPHYYIPIQININHDNEPTEKIIDKSVTEKDVLPLQLDREQIKIINDINPGEHLILACAGSGKSAILIAKAFKLAAENPKKQILLTCFNQNLYQYYQWQIDVSGYTEKNVTCRTFHRLCQDLLIENGISVPTNYGQESFHDEVFIRAQKALEAGKIKLKYDAIFIDEIQVFKKEWIIFCYNLLKNKQTDSHYFVICGDNSQNVKGISDLSLAPWDIKIEGFPRFDKHTIRIETNYRNTIQINNVVTTFSKIVIDYYKKFKINVNYEEHFLRGIAKRHGEKPELILSNRTNETSEVIKLVKKLNKEKGIPFTEIAVLIPQRQFLPRKYFILRWLIDKFEEEDIRTTVLLANENQYKRYGERDGVIISTIESTLGLDFKAVIICGLFPLGLFEGIHTEKLLNPSDDIEKKEAFVKTCNQLYTGLTRAKDYLYVVLSQDPKKNLFAKILQKTWSEFE